MRFKMIGCRKIRVFRRLSPIGGLAGGGRSPSGFITFDDLKTRPLAALFAEADQIFNAGAKPRGPSRAARRHWAIAPRAPAVRR